MIVVVLEGNERTPHMGNTELSGSNWLEYASRSRYCKRFNSIAKIADLVFVNVTSQLQIEILAPNVGPLFVIGQQTAEDVKGLIEYLGPDRKKLFCLNSEISNPKKMILRQASDGLQAQNSETEALKSLLDGRCLLVDEDAVDLDRLVALHAVEYVFP